MAVLDFFVAMPKLCGAKDGERAAWIIKTVYKAELDGGTPFDRNEYDESSPDNRLYWAFAWEGGDEKAKEQCKRLARIILYSHYLDYHGEKYYAPLIEEQYNLAKADEANFPEIAAVMSANDARSGTWNP
jgi:hypothetical protein